MKVLEVMGSLHRGGAETMIMNYYRAFDKSKCQMDFVIHAEFDNDYREEAKSLGANIILLKRPGQIGALKYIKLMIDTIEKNGPYDAIHIHTNYQAFLSIIAAKKAGIKKIVVHSHTTNFKKCEIIVNRLFFKLFNTVNLSCGIRAGDAFFGKNNYIVLNNAINVSKFINGGDIQLNNKISNLYKNKKIIGHLGSFTYPKNHKFIIELVDKLKQKRHDFIVLLFGEGELLEDVKLLIKERKLEDFIKLEGVTSNPAVTYKMFDIFILPSIYEGFPVTLLESQLSGIYTVASDTVTQESDLGVDMIEFLKLDSDLWADKINILLDSGITHKKIKSFDDYDVDLQWKKLYCIYKSKYEKEMRQ